MIDQMDLEEIIAIHFSSFEADEVKKYAPLFSKHYFKKKEFIINDKGTCTQCYFLIDGYVRSFIEEDQMEKTLWFGEKGDLITSYHTLFSNSLAKETVEALTDCALISIPMAKFKELVQSDLFFAHFYIKLLESGYNYWERRFLILSQMNADKRYNEWIARTKHLAPHIPLGVLAQYLNIDQATLSRVRGKQRL